MPRMQTAQWRARDVARKNDLSQIETAIITSQADRWAWPGMKWNNGTKTTNDATWGITVATIKDQLLAAWMSEIPADPNGSNVSFWLWNTNSGTDKWQYIYLVAKRNGVSNAWFALMAKTEVEWSSNWVVCSKTAVAAGSQNLSGGKWYIKSTDDLSKLQLCKTISQVGQWDCSGVTQCRSNTGACCYEESGELRYILVY